jgi:type IV secretory pathway TraG/TraD family ATPase VirD4
MMPQDIAFAMPLFSQASYSSTSSINQSKKMLSVRISSQSACEEPQGSGLLMLDEFPSLGRLDFFESALAFMAAFSTVAMSKR